VITDEVERELRSAFARAAADFESPEQARQRLLQRDYHPKAVNRALAAGLAAAAVAVTAAIAVPLAAGPGAQPAAAGPVMRLASYAFRMPAGYQLTAATSAPCHAFAIIALPASLLPPHGPVAQNPPYGAGMKAAASASGGCIVAVLAPRYTPTTAMPDPEAPAGAHPAQVGRYHGSIIDSRMFVPKSRFSRRNAEHGFPPGWSRFTQLYVQLPAGGGKMRDLIIGAKKLSDSALIKIAANGLSS
jgi:hypothetical protein